MKRRTVFVLVLVVMLLTSCWKLASQSLTQALRGGVPQENSIYFTQPPEITHKDTHWKVNPHDMGELTVTIKGNGDLSQLDVLTCP